MQTCNDLNKEQIKDLLNANPIIHDAVWLSNCVQAIGMERTNKLNNSSIRSMVKIEAND